MISQLILYRKAEELATSIHVRLKHFNRRDQVDLAKTIKETTYDILGSISLAHSVRSKRLFYAQQTDAHLHKLQALIKIAKKSRGFSLKVEKHLLLKVTELKKINSGYIKSSVSKR